MNNTLMIGAIVLIVVLILAWILMRKSKK